MWQRGIYDMQVRPKFLTLTHGFDDCREDHSSTSLSLVRGAINLIVPLYPILS